MDSFTGHETMIREPEFPAGAQHGVFSFNLNGFNVSQITRESVRTLRALLFPELLATAQERETAEQKAAIITPRWVEAQLYHYGFVYPPDADPSRAKAQLLDMVARGLCEVVPFQISAIKGQLEREFQEMIARYNADMRVFHDSQLPERRRVFDDCTTPAEEAKCDGALFLRKYFVNESGIPHRSVTRNLMLLEGYHNEDLTLLGRVERIPGLHVADGGSGLSSVVIIGWDRTRVIEKANAIDMERSSGRGVQRDYQNWEALMKLHQEYHHFRTTQPNSVDPAGVLNRMGLFALQAERIEREWPSLAKEMQLRMFHKGLAIFDLGIIVGMMVFAETPERLREALAKDMWNYKHRDYETQYTNIEDNARSLFFRWRGYNTQSGVMYYDPDNQNYGVIEFADARGTSFEGSIRVSMPVLGDQVQFHGLKIGDQPGEITMDWNELSHLPSERVKAIHLPL